MKKFGDMLKHLRISKKITQEALAKVFNTGKASICNYEKNYRLPDADKIVEFAKYFGVTIDYIMGEGFIEKNEIPQKHIDVVTNDKNYTKEKLLMEITQEAKELLDVFSRLTQKEKEYVIEDSRTLLSNKSPYYYFLLEKDEYNDISNPKLSIEEKLQFLFDNEYLNDLKTKELTISSGNLIPYHLNQELVNNFLAKKQKPNM